MTDDSYVPAMLRPGWVLEKYYGWSIIHDQPVLKILKKKHGPIRKYLLLAHNASDEQISAASSRCGLLGPHTMITLNDFSSQADDESRVVDGVRYRRVTANRWFGVGTFVLDLSEGVDALWARMPPKERSACRQAEKLGVKVEFATRPGDDEIGEFLELYGRMARERGLESPRRNILRRMFSGGDLLMTRCIDARGRSAVFNLIYVHGDQGYFLYSARAEEIPGGAGRYGHWLTIKKLKAAGFRWYDLGLVASRNDYDGIYWFKRSFGGEFVDSGREYEYVPRGLATAYGAFRALRRRLRGP